uniref:Uncharacterized protein n=1 Tax=Octopus bimaculoides TaxID=37653 RepID=A0A0L8I336_OCTBM
MPEDKMSAVSEIINENQCLSPCVVAANRLNLPKTFVHKILRDNLGKRPNHLQGFFFLYDSQNR